MNELIINENISPNHLMNGNAISDEIVGNNYVNDFNDESISSESNPIQLNDTLKQRDALIKQLSERLQETLKSRNDVSQMADLMALQIEELKKQLRLVSSSLLNKPVEEHPILVDFQCQTEWNEESSIEYIRRQSEYEVSHDVNAFSAVMEDKSEQTIQTENLCESEVQTDNDILHRNCREELEKAKLNLVNEFTEREKKIESELLEQINQLEQQMKRDRQTYIEESKKMDNQIFNLKSQISDIERMRRQSKSDESDFHEDDIQNFKPRVSESSSPLQPSSPLLPIQSDNDPRSTSRSPIHANLQKYVPLVILNLIYFYYGFCFINFVPLFDKNY
jgi:hypothetical protein